MNDKKDELVNEINLITHNSVQILQNSLTKTEDKHSLVMRPLKAADKAK